MPESIRYRAMKPGEENAVSNLVRRVFEDHVAPLFSDQGIEEFLSYAAPGPLRERSRSDHFVLVAKAGQRIVGAIEVRDYDHISLLFVDPAVQRAGIGRELLNRALARCRRHNPALEAVDVHSSPNAVPAYVRLGFRAQGPEQVTNGIRFVPMVRDVS